MILILAGKLDQPARKLAETWRAHDARLVTPADLSRPGWCHHIGDSGPEIAVASGERIPVSSIDGVLSRLPGTMSVDLPHIVEQDREYVAAEINAFLTAWLTQLSCLVINRPTTNGLMGAPHAPEGWIAIASRAGLRLPWTRRVYPQPVEPGWPHDAITVSVLGDRCFGNVDPALAAQACRLTATAGVELLAVMFSHAGADATFLGAHLWPDVSIPELSAALLTRFSRTAHQGLAPTPAIAAERP
jgi:hypothetical protein